MIIADEILRAGRAGDGHGAGIFGERAVMAGIVADAGPVNRTKRRGPGHRHRVVDARKALFSEDFVVVRLAVLLRLGVGVGAVSVTVIA